MIDDLPPRKGEEVLRCMEKAIDAHTNYMICMGRGSGKTCYSLITTIYAIATGRQRFAVIISNSSQSAAGLMDDIFKYISDPDTPFAKDYPNISLPFILCGGSFRRRQSYNDRPTDIVKNSKQIVIASITKDGKKLPASGATIAIRGISSGIRGLKKGTMRPTLVLLDDLQTSEIAMNPESVSKLLGTIKKDVMPLAGKERLSII